MICPKKAHRPLASLTQPNADTFHAFHTAQRGTVGSLSEDENVCRQQPSTETNTSSSHRHCFQGGKSSIPEDCTAQLPQGSRARKMLLMPSRKWVEISLIPENLTEGICCTGMQGKGGETLQKNLSWLVLGVLSYFRCPAFVFFSHLFKCPFYLLPSFPAPLHMFVLN